MWFRTVVLLVLSLKINYNQPVEHSFIPNKELMDCNRVRWWFVGWSIKLIVYCVYGDVWALLLFSYKTGTAALQCLAADPSETACICTSKGVRASVALNSSYYDVASLLAALGPFCAAAGLLGGSGGLTGGLQMRCFSTNLVRVTPSESPGNENNGGR